MSMFKGTILKLGLWSHSDFALIEMSLEDDQVSHFLFKFAWHLGPQDWKSESWSLININFEVSFFLAAL